MSKPETKPNHAAPSVTDPFEDCAREEAAYAKVAAEYARLHLGKVALVRGDEVIGVYNTADEAVLDGFKRFGDLKFLVPEIRDPKEPPPFISLIDLRDPSLRWLDRKEDA